jgi:hypothetical protein
MPGLAIFTKSFAGDFESFRDLHDSVRRFTENDVIHHVAVPERDVSMFRELASPRLRIVPVGELLPRRFVSTYSLTSQVRKIPRLGQRLPPIDAVNVLHPWPPIRGWILQQVVKMSAISRLDADVVVIIDSDIALIRPLTVDQFVKGDAVRFYRSPRPLTPDLTRHFLWHESARRLLGMAEDDAPLYDYVSPLIAWDPGIVRKIQYQIEATTERHWAESVAALLHFSEYILYGRFIDSMGTEHERSFTEDFVPCHGYWEYEPLTMVTAEPFIQSIRNCDVAVLVQSHSSTPPDVRRQVIAAAQERASSTRGD